MQRALINRYYNKLFLGMICLLAIYLIARTYFVDITDDEAWSFYNVKKFWYVETLCTGNTHWFNFLAIKISLLFGFDKVWQIRWFSVLSGIGFLYVIYLWIKILSNLTLKLLALSIALLHPYLLEYLTLARGYSTALCFMSLSILFLVIAFKKQDSRKFYILSLVLSGCSAISNFNFFYFFVAFYAIYFCENYFKNGLSFLKSKNFYMDSLFSVAITFFVLRALLFIRECSNDIADFGGENLVDSVFGSYLSLLKYNGFHMPVGTVNLLSYAFFSLVLFSSSFGAFNFKSSDNKLYSYTSIILLMMLGLTVINKWCFGVLYPTDRTALLFYPLIAIVIVEFAGSMLNKYSTSKIIIFVVSAVLVINFLFSVSLTKGKDHPYCNGSGKYFEYLDKIHAGKVGIPLELYCVYSKYYKITGTQFEAESVNTFGRDIRWINKNKLENFDYLLLFPPYNLSYYKNENVTFKGIKYFPKTGTLIVKVIKN